MTDDSLSREDLRQAAIRGLRWTVIARPVSEVVNLAALVVCARLIAPAEFGRYAIAVLIADLTSIVAAGVGAALVQRTTVTKEHLQSGFAVALGLSVAVIGLAFVLIGTIIVPLFGERTAALVRLSTPLCLVFAAGTVPQALLQRQLAFRRLGAIDVGNAAVGAVVSIGLAIAGLNGAALVLGVLAGGLAATTMAWIWAPPPFPRFYPGPARDVMRFGLPAALAGVSWAGFRNCDYAIVGARLGVLQAGFYFRAYTLAVDYQKKVSKLMTTVGFPVLARTRSGDDLNEVRGRMVGLLTLLLFPLLALLAIVAPVLIPWLFGARWTPAVLPTQILALGGAATLAIDAVGAALMAAGRARALLFYGWAHFAAYGLTVFIVAPLGLMAVAISAAVVHALFLVVAYVLMLQGSSEKPLRRLWDDLSPAAIGCVALAVAAVPVSVILTKVHVAPLVYLAAVTLSAAAGYLVALRAVFPRSLESMRSFITHLLPSRRRRRLTPLLAPGARRSVA